MSQCFRADYAGMARAAGFSRAEAKPFDTLIKSVPKPSAKEPARSVWDVLIFEK